MAQKKKGRGKHSLHYWQAHIRKQQESDLSRAEYCRQHNLSYHAMAYWQRKVSKPFSAPTTLVPVPVGKIIRRPVINQQAGVKILLNNDIAIEVAEQFSPVALNRVLSVLEQR